MLHIYKKCEKSLDNLHGIIEITNPSEIDRPFLLCLSAQDSYDKSVFGIIKEGARASRVRTSDELASGYKIDEVPVDFIGVHYKRDTIKQKRSTAVLEELIYPYLSVAKTKEDLMKKARMINIFAYCDGTRTYLEIEQGLTNKLLNDGYSEEDIKDILSQISLVSISTEVDLSDVKATTILFKDANDVEVYDYISKMSRRKIEELGREAIIGTLKKNGNAIAYVYNGTGNHELREYLSDENIVKPALCAVICQLLTNSIKNKDSKELIPINAQDLLKTVIRFNGEYGTLEEHFEKIEGLIDYHGATKYTESEHELLLQLDIAYKNLQAIKQSAEQEKAAHQKEHERNQLLINGIKEKCSDVAFAQIVVKNGMWNADKTTQEQLQMKTDREIREEYEQSLSEGQTLK